MAAHRDSQIEGLDCTQEGLAEQHDSVMVLGIDSVIVVVIVIIVISNNTGIMGKGLGKGSGTNVIGLAEDGAIAAQPQVI